MHRGAAGLVAKMQGEIIGYNSILGYGGAPIAEANMIAAHGVVLDMDNFVST